MFLINWEIDSFSIKRTIHRAYISFKNKIARSDISTTPLAKLRYLPIFLNEITCNLKINITLTFSILY